jgi:hypothetical protein
MFHESCDLEQWCYSEKECSPFRFKHTLNKVVRGEKSVLAGMDMNVIEIKWLVKGRVPFGCVYFTDSTCDS